jgi:hypothetical protein
VVDNTGGTGIVWGTTADIECGINNLTGGSGEAACADSDAAGLGAPAYDTELVTNPFDLSGAGAISLTAAAYYRDVTFNANDYFAVDVWNGSAWTNELRWDEDHRPDDIDLDLSAYAGLSNVQVRFKYAGNGWDWYAQVDDVALDCSLPEIEVEPGSLASTQAAGVSVDRTLTISNTGSAALTWNLFEQASGTSCSAPADIPWASATPTGGSVPVGNSTDVTVTFDSSGYSSGVYAGTLCIDSNDISEPLVAVPLQMTVTGGYGVALSGDAAKSGPPGTTVRYTLYMTNTGGLADTFNLGLSGGSWSAAIDGPTSVPLAAGASAAVVVEVSVPSGAAVGSDDTVTLTATSQGDTSKSATADLTTTSGYLKTYLPIILKP